MTLQLVRFSHCGEESYGVLRDNSVIDLKRMSTSGISMIPQSIEELISLGLEAEVLMQKAIKESQDIRKKDVLLKKSEITIKAPITAPSKIICLGLNYKDHAEEGGAPVPSEPIIFMKPRTCIIGPDEPVIKPRFVKELDYEVELAVVISKKGKNIPPSEAKHHIFGYMVFNDISARDIQFKDGQWTRGKSFDTFAPTGPCITTSAQVGDPNNLGMYTRVNGEVRQNSSTRLMIFDITSVIYHISRVMTLEPCDIIATGTPAGVAAFMKPERKFLRPSDIVEVEIEKIGALRNSIVEP